MYMFLLSHYDVTLVTMSSSLGGCLAVFRMRRYNTLLAGNQVYLEPVHTAVLVDLYICVDGLSYLINNKKQQSFKASLSSLLSWLPLVLETWETGWKNQSAHIHMQSYVSHILRGD